MSGKIDKKSTNKKTLYTILLVVFSVIFVVSAYFAVKILVIEPYQNTQKLNDIKDIYYSNDDAAGETVPEDSTIATPELEKLREINSDIKGWIKIDNTPIDYPVLYSNDYLYKDYKKNNSKYGSIFLDTVCVLEENPKNILLHGHHMRNGSMFAKICNYLDLNFYKENPTFIFNSINKNARWKVFAAFFTNTDPAHGEIFNYLQPHFSSTSEFLNFVYKMRIRSNITTPVDIKDDDEIITLSTCSYEMKDFRTVVVARKVRPGEDPAVDVSLAKYNPNPLYPAAYHKKIGSKMPQEKTFEEDLANITWYTR